MTPKTKFAIWAVEQTPVVRQAKQKVTATTAANRRTVTATANRCQTILKQKRRSEETRKEREETHAHNETGSETERVGEVEFGWKAALMVAERAVIAVVDGGGDRVAATSDVWVFARRRAEAAEDERARVN